MAEVTGLVKFPVLMVIVFADEQWLEAVVMYDLARRVRGGALVGTMLLLIAVSEPCLNGSLILCTTHNSALTTSVVGVLKGVVAAVLGFFFLGGARFSLLNVTGITVAMSGGLAYVLVKHLAGRGQAAQPSGRSSSTGKQLPK